MKHNIIPVNNLLGISNIEPQIEEVASDIVNMVRESDGSWTTRIGYEKYFTGDTQYSIWTGTARVSSIFNWRRVSAGTDLFVYSVGNYLYTHYNNPPTKTTIYANIEPASDVAAGPQYTVFGNFLIIATGTGPALVYNGSTVRPLGWTIYPTPPTTYGCDPGDGSLVPFAPASWPPEDNATRMPIPADAPVIGLGDTTANFHNKYRYKMSYVSDTGCESPVSTCLSDTVSWVSKTTPSRYGVAMRIGTGPEGTVARKIYRTSNIAQTFDNNTMYLIGTVRDNTTDVFIDIWSDYELNEMADQTRILNPFKKPVTIATYASRLWVVDAEQPTTIYYSKAYKPEEFSVEGVVTVNSNTGGVIRALVPWQEYLIVLRDNAIDLIITNDGINFISVPVTTGIGDVGPNSVQIVPGQGVLFLSTTGVYQVVKHDQTDRVTVQNISRGIPDALRRLNTGRIATATSVVSPLWGEYHVYFDGDVHERVGLVLSFFGDAAWSVREGFPVGPATVDSNGNIIFAHNIGCFSDGSFTLKAETGLFVLSRIHTLGYSASGGIQDWYTEPGPPTISKYVSSWHYAGDRHINKAFRYLYLYLKSTGDQPLNVQTAVDGRRDYSINSASVAQLVTGEAQPVWNDADFGTVTWQGDELIEVRFDIDAVGSRFRFKIETMNDLALLGYAVAFTDLPGQIMPGRSV